MKRLWFFLLVIALVAPAGIRHSPTAYAQSETTDYLVEAEALLDQMSPEERVGQLFLITFRGSQIQVGSPLYDLLTSTGIGGVVLLAENDNFTSEQNLPLQSSNLINTLQELTLTGQSAGTIQPSATITPTAVATPGPRQTAVPLLVGTYHGGNGHAELMSGVTELPSLMSLGATWSRDRSEVIGEVVGQELADLGFNLVLGPSLAVLDNPTVFAGNGFGTGAFGGSPYWVGQLGDAYVAGLHKGSEGRLAVIATGFPGGGSSDRPLDQEIATIRKTLPELQQTELLPFGTVTRLDNPGGAVDGLMTAHLRYEGFQGSIRSTTPPVSFDPQALEVLFNLPAFSGWRGEGGLLVSPPLGVPAVQRFFNATSNEFPHRQVAKDALLAGNDLLYINEFGPVGSDRLTQLENIEDTIAWFIDRYDTDPAFRQRVDAAVTRILQLKLRIFDGDFGIGNVLTATETIEDRVGQGQGAVFSVAQRAITLLAPSQPELADRLPAAPTSEDRLVIFTDLKGRQQCSLCPVRPKIALDEIEERLVSLYGPQASGEVISDQIDSFSFDDLTAFLDAPLPIIPPESEVLTGTVESPTEQATAVPPRPTSVPVDYQVQESLTSADWVIIALQEVTPNTTSEAFNRLLAERPEMLRNKIVIVLSFSQPIYLDATEISQLNAYFGLFSTSSSFIDAAVRMIFRDLSPRGAAPISVEGLRYDLTQVTLPNGRQTIELFLLDTTGEPLDLGPDPLSLQPGQTLKLQTGIILDENDHPVPDGTVVRFTQEDRVSGFFDVIGEEQTINGVATFDYILENRPGQYRLRVSAGSAGRSEEIDIAIGENSDAAVSLLTPTPEPTATSTPTLTPTATPEPTETPAPTPTTPPIPDEGGDELQLRIFLSELQQLIGLVAGLTGVILFAGRGELSAADRLQRVSWGVIGGLLGYIYFVLDLPGVTALQVGGAWIGLLITLVFGLMGLVAAMYAQWSARSRPNP